MDVKVHSSIDQANPDGVIVTLFGDFDGQVRGWHIGPVTCDGGVVSVPRSAPADRLLGAVAITRAFELSQRLGVELSLVDPDDLWSILSGDITDATASKTRAKRAAFPGRLISRSRE